MKGISIIISYIFSAVILLAILSLVSFGAGGYYSRNSVTIQTREAESLASSISYQTISLYNSNQYSTLLPPAGGNVTVAEISFSVPEKISGQPYRIDLLPRGDFWVTVGVNSSSSLDDLSFSGQYSSVRITTTGRNPVIVTLPMNNIPIKTEGSSRIKTDVKLSYVKISDGQNTTDKILLS